MVTLSYSLADHEFRSTASTGMFNFANGLVRELATRREVERFTVFGNHTLDLDKLIPSNIEVINYDRAMRRPAGRILWDQWFVYRAAVKSGNRWLFLPKGYGSFLCTCPVKLAVYIHDIMPVFYFDRYLRGSTRTKQSYFRRIYAATLRSADLVFTNTAFTKCEIERWAREQDIVCPPVVVVGYGFDGLQPAADDERLDQIVLFVREDPHKKTELALSYLNRWRAESGFEGRIVCLGQPPATADLASLEGDWDFKGRVPPDAVFELLRRSRAVVHMSEYEGFGMPPVEAALAGSASVYSGVPATREAMGDAGCPFENDDYASFARAMSSALETPEQTRRQWAQSLAARHNWRAVGDRVLEGLNSF